MDIYSKSFIILLGVVGACVIIWSYYYMDVESVFSRFINLLFLFLFCMTLLILSSNLFLSLVGWDGLGFASFLLIVYYKNRPSLGSGMITALSNRLGDCLFIFLLACFHKTNFRIWAILLILMSITKRAQIPFSSWLPAAMAAPTPVRALVHSSTLVTAGIYMIIRYNLHDADVLVNIGRATIILAGVSACMESDLKKIVALRTLSQLGVMMVSIGANEKSYCFFHLLSHAFFKSLLFLCVGTSIHSLYGTQDTRHRKIAVNSYTAVFGSVSIISLRGFPFTSGFFRKHIILEVGERSRAVCIFYLGMGLTLLYSYHMIKYLLKRTTQRSLNIGEHSWMVKAPLYVLGVSSITFGSTITHFCGPLISRPDFELLTKSFCFILIFNWNIPIKIHTLTPTIQRIAYMPVIDLQWNKWYVRSFISSLRNFSVPLGVGIRVLFFLLI